MLFSSTKLTSDKAFKERIAIGNDWAASFKGQEEDPNEAHDKGNGPGEEEE